MLCYVNFGHLTDEVVLEAIPLPGDYAIPGMTSAGAGRMARNLALPVTRSGLGRAGPGQDGPGQAGR